MNELHQIQEKILVTPGVQIGGFLFELQTAHFFFKRQALTKRKT